MQKPILTVFITLLLCGLSGLSLAQTAPGDSTSSAHLAAENTPTTSVLTSTSSSIDRRAEPGPFDLITNLPHDWRDWAVDNIQFKYWPQISLIVVSTAAMIVYDNQIWKPFEKAYNRNSSYRNAADLFVDIGDGRFQFGLSAAYLAYGAIAGDKRAIRCASQISEVILASGGVVQLLKHVTGRQSPIDISTNPTGTWDWFPNQITYLYHTSNYDAFPSGHLTTALGTLVVIANNYPEQKWILPVGYVACAGLAVGLVSQSVHWWSDYPLAIALGIGFGNLLSPDPTGDVSVPTASDHTTDTTKKKDTGLLGGTVHTLLSQTTFAPSYVPDGAGIAMCVKF